MELESIEELASILQAWRQKTGSDPASYFDIRPDSITPKFWSGSLDTPRLHLEVAPIGTTLLDIGRRTLLDANLSDMLAYAASSQSLSAGTAHLSMAGGRHEALIAVFCEEFRLARRRQVLRRYISANDSLASPRGRISFPSQCYESIRRPGRFSSEWVALTEDIPENRIFKEVLSRYRPRCSSNLRGKIDACVAELDSVRNVGDIRMEWPRIRTDRLPACYLSLLKLSKALLDDEGAGLFAGDTLATSQIVFTSRLFERYIAKELSWAASQAGLNAKSQERGTYLCVMERRGKAFELIPDLRIADSLGRTMAILDTKWKHLDHNAKGLGIAREDMYQALIYAAKYECCNAVLLYPDVSIATGAVGYMDRFSARLAGIEYSIHIAKIPLLGKDLMDARAFLAKLLPALCTPADVNIAQPLLAK